MFGSRNRRTKSRKERNYAPPVANSWLRHWFTHVYQTDCLSFNNCQKMWSKPHPLVRRNSLIGVVLPLILNLWTLVSNCTWDIVGSTEIITYFESFTTFYFPVKAYRRNIQMDERTTRIHNPCAVVIRSWLRENDRKTLRTEENFRIVRWRNLQLKARFIRPFVRRCRLH